MVMDTIPRYRAWFFAGFSYSVIDGPRFLPLVLKISNKKSYGASLAVSYRLVM